MDLSNALGICGGIILTFVVVAVIVLRRLYNKDRQRGRGEPKIPENLRTKAYDPFTKSEWETDEEYAQRMRRHISRMHQRAELNQLGDRVIVTTLRIDAVGFLREIQEDGVRIETTAREVKILFRDMIAIDPWESPEID